ncbi:olfactory receptor 6S1-like [Anomaloglossus baeobatrachus]|uniref:olfactory receptor 6S1-like n=1 Tax=Anomaloglossus baeobatrachus TaxID=238106 RepID=UPI003F4F9405
MYKLVYNKTTTIEFLLSGFSNFNALGHYLFAIILTIYIVTITANIMIIAIIRIEQRLHKPMYFFIGSLSFLEIWYPSVTVPKLLWSLILGKHSISRAGCMTQFFFHFSFGVVENFLLAIMAVDRYIAICKPLRYTLIMSPDICFNLLLGCWFLGFIIVFVLCLQVSNLSFCSENKIDHYYCDFAPLIRLSCSDTTSTEMLFFAFACFVIFGSFLIISISYICIIQTTITFPTSSGRRKAFSTCASHVTVVILFYGTTMFMFIRPTSGGLLHLNKIISVIPSIVTPLLNPIIYTLRNQEVKEAVKKIVQKMS